MKDVKQLDSLRELSRKIHLNDKHKNHSFHYHSNIIRTTKYTLITFLPKSIYMQFLRLANVYFLIAAVLSSIHEVSSVSPVTSIIPLVFVLATSIVREGFEDWGRHKNDNATNGQTAHIIPCTGANPEEEIKTKWSHVQVGDIVKVYNNEEIPADVVLLTTSEEGGLAYVETANLDGERNLKQKNSKFEVREMIRKDGLSKLKGALLVEQPNQKIHSFKGIMEVEGLETIYLNYSNIVLRGTHIKNTEWAIGLVIYTGHDTKLVKNQGNYRNKKSILERNLNKFILLIFVIQLLLCVVLTVLFAVFEGSADDPSSGVNLIYVAPKNVPSFSRGRFVDSLITYASFLLLLNTMIPISLMVSLELAKWFQSYWLSSDHLCWEPDQRSKVLNMLIHDDLGRVEYIFADKTGTLTANDMKFMYASINGVIYSRDQLIDNLSPTPLLKDERPDHIKQAMLFDQFWLTISLCHDVVIDVKHRDEQDPRKRYQGSSPDEVELVSMAAEIHYIFTDKNSELYTLNVYERLRKFRILAKIDFNSNRKRMSVIARDLETEKIYLFCKGADNVIMERIRPDTERKLIKRTNDDLIAFSKEGLRTLCIAYKELEEEDFIKWYEKYNAAEIAQYNILDQQQDPKEDLIDLENEIEKGLTLLGVTALEDKLQEGVSETISDITKAGIKVWMLTGDKLETAENIGYATHLIADHSKIYKVKTSDVEKTLEEYNLISQDIEGIKSGKTSFKSQLSMTESECSSPSARLRPVPFKSFALIIDGEAITHTFHNEKLKKTFIDLIPKFRTVICCRSTPNQKADVVSFVKHNLHKVTLAIGDGGNDVNMIQKADIGIGLFGKEGNQAAFASDYAFPKFFHLWRLLFVHGRWFYMRTTNFVNFFFYKNFVFTFPQFWFNLYTGYSGQTYYNSYYLPAFNSFFTAVAPVYYTAQEQDINPRENETIRRYLPYVYAEFRDKREMFTTKTFTFWGIVGVGQSLIIYYFTELSFRTQVNSSGLMYDVWDQSATTFTGVLVTVCSVVFMGTNLFHIVTFICYFIFTVLVYFPCGLFVFDAVDITMSDMTSELLKTPNFWFVWILVSGLCGMMLYIPKMWRQLFYPTLCDLLMKDRNSKHHLYTTKEFELDDGKYLRPTSSFQFNQRIMMAGWANDSATTSPTSPNINSEPNTGI